MDPRSGAILALANWPQVSAQDTGPTAVEDMEDRAVGLDYEPGSTFKVVAVSGALEQGLITPSTPFNIPDQIQVADRTIHDDTEHPEETLTTAQILARSSNVGAIKIGALEGADSFNNWVHRFGFGTPTGVDLPGEEVGVTLPLSEYSGSSMGNLPIGQGELVTPMQMATAYAAIANGGILRPPHIVSAIAGHPQPEPAGHRVLSATTAAEVRHMLEGVLGPEGTASQVSIPGYQLAGKTGTASKIDPATGEYSQSAFVASFIGFAPASDPKLLCAVVVDEPQSGSIYGGTVAAPAFGQIMSFALPYMGIAPG
jgi:cell division protein FtsI (penicillin-binding protein 3)